MIAMAHLLEQNDLKQAPALTDVITNEMFHRSSAGGVNEE